MRRFSAKKLCSAVLALVLAASPCYLFSACDRSAQPVAFEETDAAKPSDINIYVQFDEPVTEPPTEPPTEEPTTAPTEAADETSSHMHADEMEEVTAEVVTLTPEEIIAINPLMKGVMDQIAPIVEVCGFAYDPEQDIFFSTMYPIQRFGGYNTFYDFVAYHVGLYYNTRKIYFSYGGRDWMVQIWKGQYGITVGAEIGVYYKDDEQWLQHYDTIEDQDLVTMGFTLYKNGEEYFHRGPEKHWWLTGFKLLDVAVMLQLTMVAYFDWETDEQADAFQQGLDRLLISDTTYERDGTEFWVNWTI